MIQFYKNIFYHLYKWKKKNKDEEYPEIMAVLILTVIMGFNILSVLFLIVFIDIGNVIIIKYESINRFYQYLPLLLLIIINYLLFVYKGKYKKILIEFEKKELVYNIKKGRLYFLSFVITILFFIGVMLLFYIRNEF